MTILDERPLTDAERAAIADEPRPGVWVQNDRSFPGDGRALSQHETDRLIVGELHRMPDQFGQAELVAVVGWPVAIKFDTDKGKQHAFEQRGGLHSDPLVRLLAFRAWGDRDRAWQKRETARTIGASRALDRDLLDRIRATYCFESIAATGAEYTAQRDGRQARATVNRRADDRRVLLEVVLDCFDELDAKLAAGGEPLPSEPLTFDFSSPPR
jgi:hypothetical protein